LLVDDPPPPQPIIVADAVSTTNPTQAVSHAPRRVSRLRAKYSGSSRIGNSIHALEVEVTVSVKTTMI